MKKLIGLLITLFMATFILVMPLSCSSSDDDDDNNDTTLDDDDDNDTTEDDDDDTAGNCPSLDGDWEIIEHCSPSLIGEIVTITQNECSFSLTSPVSNQTVTGSISEDGSFTVVSDVSGDACPGTVSSTGDTATLDCDCAQKIKRVE